ncbi:MAG TPA: M48 family metalloprotease [Candidatus Binatia bacterium]|nr:M48 family metalloprotease [Candidatus Binatia bacterium]
MSHRLAVVLLPALLVAAAGAFAQSSPTAVDLPRIGEPADTALSPQEEQRIGARIVAELYAGDYVLEDPEVSDYATGLLWRLVASADMEPQRLQLFVMKDPRINAFALPGGYIGLNAGTLNNSRSESELAGVLAHELAHITQRHIARTVEGTQTATIATWAAALAAILAASADPQVVVAALALGQGINEQRQVNFTRAHELEADRIGIRTLAAANFDPEAMANFFVRLEQQSRLYGNQVPEFLQTHPVNTTRISEARTRAAGYNRRRVADPTEFALIQARARVLSMERPSEAVEYFAGQQDRNSLANRYGLALAYSRLGEYARAIEILAPALAQAPNQVNLGLLDARIRFAQGRTDDALKRLYATLEHHPKYAPAILEAADSLITAGRPDDARQLLLSHEQELGTRAETYRLLALAARDDHNTVEAHYQMATYLYQRGDGPGALSQLDSALRMSSLSKQERARIRARRAELVAALPKGTQPSRR